MPNETQESSDDFLPVDLTEECAESADEPSLLLLELIEQSRRKAGVDGSVRSDRDVEMAGLPKEYALSPLRD